jgi:hypothetical protein
MKRIRLALSGLFWLCLAPTASSGEIAFLAGESLSRGLGESPISPAVKASYSSSSVTVAGSLDFSRKLETRAGWIAGLNVDAHAFGPVSLGADYRRRNGGRWCKNVVFTRVGVDIGFLYLIYRQEVLSDAGLSRNNASALRVSRRFASTGQHHLVFEPAASVLRFRRMDGSRTTGFLLQVWLGIGRSVGGGKAQ